MKIAVQKIMIGAQLFLSALTFVFIVAGIISSPTANIDSQVLVINAVFATIVDVLYFAICLLCVVELFFLAKKAHAIRLVTILFFLIVTIVMWLETPAEQGVPSILLVSIVYTIMLIVALIKCPTKVENGYKKITIPNIFFNTSDFIIFVCAAVPISFAAITAICFFSIANQAVAVISLRIFGLYILGLIVYVMYLMLKITFKVMSYQKTLNYKTLQKSLNSAYKSKISIEKRAFLQCFESNFLYNINKKQADKLFLSIVPPQKNLEYLMQYKLMELTYLLNNQHYQEFEIKLKQMRGLVKSKKSSVNKMLTILEYMQKVGDGTISLAELDTHFPATQSKIKLQYLSNIYVRAMYFTKINDPENAAPLKQILVAQARPLTEIYTFCHNFIVA